MNLALRRTSKVGVIALSCSLSALLLAGCIPLDEPTPSPTASRAPSSLTPESDPTNWDGCAEPTISHAEPAEKGWRIIGAMELEIADGSRIITDYRAENLTASIMWDGPGPNTDRFTEEISDVIGYPTSGVILGQEPVARLLIDIEEPGITLGYRAVEEFSVPITLSCGNFVAFGTVDTLRNRETGVIDCSLPADEAPEMPSEMARKQWCPGEGSL